MKRLGKGLRPFLFAGGACLVLAGCQNASGVDMQQILSNTAQIQSSESSMTIQLNTDLSGIPPQLAPLLQHVTINLTDIKSEDANSGTGSMTGELDFAQGKIPFQAEVRNHVVTFKLAGIDEPIVESMGTAANPADPKQTKALRQALNQLLADNLPNPKDLKAASRTETIHGDSVSGYEVTFSLDQTEMADSLKGFLQALSQDSAGLQQFAAVLYDEFRQQLTESGNPVFQYRDSGISFIQDIMKTYLDQVAAALNHQDLSHPNGTVRLQADAFVDQQMMLRHLKGTLDAANNNEQVNLSFEFERWNINQPVPADKIDTSGGFLKPEQLQDRATFLHHLQSGTTLYHILNDQFQLFKIDYLLDPQTSVEDLRQGRSLDSFDPAHFIYANRHGVSYVGLRQFAEQSGAAVTWDNATRQIGIQRDNGTQILLTIGSKQALINGAATPMPDEVVMVKGTAMIPLRFVSEHLGATVEYDDTTGTVSANFGQ